MVTLKNNKHNYKYEINNFEAMFVNLVIVLWNLGTWNNHIIIITNILYVYINFIESINSIHRILKRKADLIRLN